jgi:hypothetical protein
MRLVFALHALLLSSPYLGADTYDRYTEAVLAQAAEGPEVLEVKRITAADIARHGNLIGNSSGLFLIVKTNEGQWAKLLVQLARQKTPEGSMPIALIERGVTYKAGGDRVVAAAYPALRLYDRFLLNLDLGQVVPEKLGGDVKYLADDGDGFLEAVGKARLFIVVKHSPEVAAKPQGRPTVGDVFEAEVIAGAYKLHDDGRRRADLTLKVDDEGNLTGEYVSEQSGRKYDVTGKVQPNKHHIVFAVKFPQSTQQFTGWVFTKDASAIAGFTSIQGRDFGFYATRAGD